MMLFVKNLAINIISTKTQIASLALFFIQIKGKFNGHLIWDSLMKQPIYSDSISGVTPSSGKDETKIGKEDDSFGDFVQNIFEDTFR